MFAEISAFSWQMSVSVCPASFCTPKLNWPITPSISWLPTFAFQSPIMKRASFLSVSSRGLIGLHGTIQIQLLQHYWLGHRLGLLGCWMVCLGIEQRSFCCFWDCTQVLHFGLFFDYESYSISSKGYIPWDIVKIQCSKYNHGVTQNEISASSGLNWSAGTGEGRIMRWWKRK